MTFSTTPVLSLCLPTYKRCALLGGALRAVLEQITPTLAPDVEVIVLDNASPDDTQAVIGRVRADFPDILLHSFRHPENVGADANFIEAVRQSRGEFVYLLSDDDILLPGAVARLISLIRAHPDMDAFAVNVREFLHSTDEEATSFFKLDGDLILRDRDQALILLNTILTFMSCLVFRRETVAARDYADKVGTLLVQAFFFVDALAPERGLYVTRETYLAKRADNHQGYRFFQIFLTHFDLIMDYALQAGYSPAAVRRTLTEHLKFLRYCVLLFKQNGAIGTIRPDYRDGLARLWRVYGPHPFALGIVATMMLMPAPLFRGMHRVYKRVKAVVRPAPAMSTQSGPR